MPLVRMPDGALVNLPDNPSAEEKALIKKILSGGESQPSATKTFAKRMGLGALPGAGGLAGAEALMAAGAPLALATGPFAPLTEAGLGLAGALGGGWLAGKAQEKALEAMPETRAKLGIDPETLAREEEAHGTAAKLGDVAGLALSMRPSLSNLKAMVGKGAPGEAAAAWKMAGAGAGLGTVASAGMQQLAHPGEALDWRDVGESALLGGFLTKPTKLLGERAGNLGRRLVGKGPKVPIVPPKPAEEGKKSALYPPLEGEPEVIPSKPRTASKGKVSAADLIGAGKLGDIVTEPQPPVPPGVSPIPPAPRGQAKAPVEEMPPPPEFDYEGAKPWEEEEAFGAAAPEVKQETKPVAEETAPRKEKKSPLVPIEGEEGAVPATKPVRLDSNAFPAADPKDHAAAISAFREGKYIVMEGFKKYRNDPAHSFFHVADSPEAARELANNLAAKTAGKPTYVEILSPKGEREVVFDKRVKEGAAPVAPDRIDPEMQKLIDELDARKAAMEARLKAQEKAEREAGEDTSASERTAAELRELEERRARAQTEALGTVQRGISTEVREIPGSHEVKPTEPVSTEPPKPAPVEGAGEERTILELPEGGEPPKPKRPILTLKGKKPAKEGLTAPLGDIAGVKPEDFREETPEGWGTAEPRERPETHTVESIDPELKGTFGIHTNRLFKNNFLEVVPSHDALPEDIRNNNSPTARAIYSPKLNKVFFIADNIPKGYDLKGLMAHEVGVHAGMETMLGTPLYEKLLKEVGDRAAAGEKPFKDAEDRVPVTTPGQNVAEERLAYLVSKYKDLPFVKRIYSQIRQWLYRKMGGRFITLSNDDVQAMALASLRRVSDLAETGRTGELRRDAALAARRQAYEATPEGQRNIANRKFSEARGEDGFEETPKSEVGEEVTPLTDEELNQRDQQEAVRDEKKKLSRNTVTGRVTEWLRNFKNRPYEELVKSFQDFSRLVLMHDRKQRAAGQLKSDEAGLYDLLVLRPSDFAKYDVMPHQKQLYDDFRNYLKESGKSEVEGLAEFKRWMIGLSEQDLRKYLHSRYVPLDETPRQLPGRSDLISPAEAREIAVKAHETSEDLHSPDARQKHGYNAEDLRNFVDYLAENHSKVGGFIPESAPEHLHRMRPDPNITDINHPAYDLAGVPQEQAARWKREYEAALQGPHGEAIKRVIDAEKALREKVQEVEKANGHWGNHTDNAIAFQRRNNYYALKGDTNAGFDRMTGTFIRGALGRFQAEQGGRLTMSDNPLTQTIADANVALSRLDKTAFLDKLYEMAQAGTLRDSEGKRVIKVLEPIKVGERRSYELPEGVTADSVILRPDGKGGFDVMQIKNNEWKEALKGIVTVQNAPMQLAGKLTRFLTSMVTKWNPGFAPMNAVRHLATNIGNLTSEQGLMTGVKVATRFITQAAKGSPFKAARAAHLLAKGDIATLNKLAEGDSFYRNLRDWMQSGGRITFNQAFSNETATKHLVEELKSGGMRLKSQEALNHVADIWNNMFEFMNREAAYDTLKNRYVEQGANPNKVNARVAAETKNLLNLELSGRHSKDMASLFGLFRAEATGAVRQIDALMAPLFTPTDVWIRKTYGTKTQIEENSPIERIVTDPIKRKELIQHWDDRRKNAFLTAVMALGFGYAAHKMSKSVAGTTQNGENEVSADDHAQWVRNLRVPTTILGPAGELLGKDNKFINVPWGFGAGALASIGAQMSALEDGDIKPKEAAEHMISAAKQSFLPVPLEDWGQFNHNPVGWAISSAAPTVLRPLLYFSWNADAFGRQVYNTRVGKYGEAYAGGDYVPEMFKGPAKAIFDASDGKYDISPHTMQFFANNYIQGLSNITQALVGNYQNLMGEKDFDLKTDLPFFSSVVGKSSDADSRRFADVENEVKKTKARLSALKNTGNDAAYDRYVDAHPDAEWLVKRYDHVRSQINNYNKRLNRLRAEPGTPKEKDEDLRDLRLMRSSYMKDLTDDYESVADSR